MFFAFSDFVSLLEFLNLFKMSDDEDSVTVDMSEIKGKPVDAIGHIIFKIDFDHFKSPFCIEKIFGLVDKTTNAVFKFKLVVSEDGARKIKFKLIYVSEEPIDCKIKVQSCPSAIFEHLRIGDELKNICYTKENLKTNNEVYFSISVLVITKTSMNNCFVRKFNDPSTSDFIVHCQDKQFHVHQIILQEKSEYFAAIFHNECIEKRNKVLKINDFPHEVVEIFLGYLYSGVLPSRLKFNDLFCLMKIADKYNANQLVDAIDSYTAQEFLFFLNGCTKDKKLSLITGFVQTIKEVQAPKIAAMIFEWRRTENGSNGLDNKQWSSLIRKNPNFAMLGGITVGRTDYQTWVQQHISWSLTSKMSPLRNDFVVLVGPIGEMKGTVKCSLI